MRRPRLPVPGLPPILLGWTLLPPIEETGRHGKRDNCGQTATGQLLASLYNKERFFWFFFLVANLRFWLFKETRDGSQMTQLRSGRVSLKDLSAHGRRDQQACPQCALQTPRRAARAQSTTPFPPQQPLFRQAAEVTALGVWAGPAGAWAAGAEAWKVAAGGAVEGGRIQPVPAGDQQPAPCRHVLPGPSGDGLPACRASPSRLWAHTGQPRPPTPPPLGLQGTRDPRVVTCAAEEGVLVGSPEWACRRWLEEALPPCPPSSWPTVGVSLTPLSGHYPLGGPCHRRLTWGVQT